MESKIMDIACINILINPSIEDVIKIEKTSGFAEKRSQDIRSNTNESTPFRVAYSTAIPAPLYSSVVIAIY